MSDSIAVSDGDLIVQPAENGAIWLRMCDDVTGRTVEVRLEAHEVRELTEALARNSERSA